MNPADPELRDKISEVAQSVGEKFGQCVDINLSDFIKKWREEYPSIRVKKREIATILRADFYAENVEGEVLRVQGRNIAKSMQEAPRKDSSTKEGPNLLAKISEELEIQLALEILSYLQTYIEINELEDFSITVNKIHELWQSKNPDKGFKSYHVGTFKKFLITVCKLQEDPSNKEQFSCNKNEIIHRISMMKGDQESTRNRGSLDYTYWAEKGEDSINIAESQGMEVKPMSGVSGGNRATDMLESNATQIESNAPQPSKKHETKGTPPIENMEERCLRR